MKSITMAKTKKNSVEKFGKKVSKLFKTKNFSQKSLSIIQ